MLKAFLSYRYQRSDENIIDAVGKLLHNLGVELVDGKHLNPAKKLTEQVKIAIAQCDLLISIRTDGENRDYLDLEVAFAASCDKPIAIVTVDDVLPNGLKSDFYLISFARGELQAAASLIAAINSIETKLALRQKQNYSHDAVESEIDREQWTLEIRTKLREIRRLFDCLDYQRSLQKADELFTSYPDCWRAGIAKSAALMFLHQLEDADRVLNQSIACFAGNSRALSHVYQNKAWLEYIKTNGSSGDREQAIDYFQRSIHYEPRLIVYVDLITVLLQANRVSEAEAVLVECLNHFPQAKKEFDKQLKVRGADFLQQIAKSSVLMKILFPKEQ
jgi:tetratricopeptide (TPR) repeat protein